MSDERGIPWGRWGVDGMWFPNLALRMDPDEQHRLNVENGYSCVHGWNQRQCKLCSEEKKKEQTPSENP